MAPSTIIQQKREAAARKVIELRRRYIEDYLLYEFPTQQAVEDILAEEIRAPMGPGSVPRQGQKRGRPPKVAAIPGVHVG